MTKPQGRDRLLVLSIALLGRELIGVAAFRKGDGYSERPEEHDPSAIHARAWRRLDARSLDASFLLTAPAALAPVRGKLARNETVSIVGMGGSNSMGQGVDRLDRWTARLQKELGARARVYTNAPWLRTVHGSGTSS